MSPLTITTRYERSPADQLRSQLAGSARSSFVRVDEQLERYAKTRSWTLGVILANVLLFAMHALSTSRNAGDEKFWSLH